MEIMHEFHGSTGEPIVEWNLSYRLSDLPWWLCTHHSPLSSWVPILCPSEQPMRAFVKRVFPGGQACRSDLAAVCRRAGLLAGDWCAAWGARALVLRLYLASKRAWRPDSLHPSLRRGRGVTVAVTPRQAVVTLVHGRPPRVLGYQARHHTRRTSWPQPLRAITRGYLVSRA
jgi:hypothetical protein